MKLDPAGIRSGDSKAMFDLIQVCKKAARIGAKRANSFSFAEDVGQDLVMLVLNKWLDHYNPELDVEPFLVESARRMSLKYRRASDRELHVGLDVTSDSEDGTALTRASQDEVDGLATAIDDQLEALSRQARDILVQRLRDRDRASAKPESSATLKAASDGRVGVRDDAGESPDRRRAARRERAARSSVQEIIQIRKQLRLGQAAMAKGMGVSVEVLRRVESGLVEGDAERLAARARAMLQGHGGSSEADVIEGEAFYLGLCKMLQVQPDNVVLVSKLLGVHRTTIFRWRTGRTIPLAAVTRHFHDLAAQLALAKEAAA